MDIFCQKGIFGPEHPFLGEAGVWTWMFFGNKLAEEESPNHSLLY